MSEKVVSWNGLQRTSQYCYISILFHEHGVCCLVVIAGVTMLVPYHLIKSLQLIWRSGMRRFHLRMPDLQMSCSDLIERWWTRIVVSLMATRVTCSVGLQLWSRERKNREVFPVGIPIVQSWAVCVDCVLFVPRSRAAGGSSVDRYQANTDRYT